MKKYKYYDSYDSFGDYYSVDEEMFEGLEKLEGDELTDELADRLKYMCRLQRESKSFGSFSHNERENLLDKLDSVSAQRDSYREQIQSLQSLLKTEKELSEKRDFHAAMYRITIFRLLAHIQDHVAKLDAQKHDLANSFDSITESAKAVLHDKDAGASIQEAHTKHAAEIAHLRSLLETLTTLGAADNRYREALEEVKTILAKEDSSASSIDEAAFAGIFEQEYLSNGQLKQFIDELKIMGNI